MSERYVCISNGKHTKKFFCGGNCNAIFESCPMHISTNGVIDFELGDQVLFNDKTGYPYLYRFVQPFGAKTFSQVIKNIKEARSSCNFILQNSRVPSA